jgi:hypothetical protein
MISRLIIMLMIEMQNKEATDSKIILPENAVEWAMLFRYK